MDYAKLTRSLSTRAVHSYRSFSRPSAALVTVALFAASPFGVQAEVLKINPSQNAGNVIELTGDLSATVTHTAEGMVIEIPGVEIALDCDEGTNNICTVTIGAGRASDTAAAEPPAPAAVEPPAPAAVEPPPADNNTGDDPCASGSPTFGCSDDGTQDGVAPAADDPTASDDTGGGSADATPDATPGYVAPPATGGALDPNDPCNVRGYNPNCSSLTAGSSTGADPFPNGASRTVNNTGVDLGSAASTAGQTVKVGFPKGTVNVLGLTLANSGSTKGNINFGPVGAVSGVDLRAWISTSADGARLGSCGYKGYVEGALSFSTDGSRGCNLSPGGTYYLNMAICSSTADDLFCSGAGAKTSQDPVTLAIEAKYGN